MQPDRTRESLSGQRPLANVSTGELIGQFLKKTVELLRKELELAKAEIGSSVRSVMAKAFTFVVAGVCLLLALALFLTAAVLALASRMPGWEAALIVGTVTAAIGGAMFLVARGKRIKKPLERTRKTIKEDVQWVRKKVTKEPHLPPSGWRGKSRPFDEASIP